MSPLSSGPLFADNVVFNTRPSLSCKDIVADNIKQESTEGSGAKTDLHALFV